VSKIKEPANPFYVLLVVAGIVFLVTACAYGLMAVRASRPMNARTVGARDSTNRPPDPQAGGQHALMTFLDRHGAEMLTWELIFLGCTTAAAMALDQRRSRRRPSGQWTSSADAEEPKIG
jgi:hypothetical protein